MRHFISFPLLFGALAVLVVSGCSGDSKKPSDKKDSGDSPKGQEAIVLEYEEIDLIPEGEPKEVKVKKGKAESAEAPKESGVTAKVEGDKLTVSAGKDAKPGTHTVTVKGGKAKDVTLKVNVKKKEKKEGEK
jgi:hypothetical protein